MTQAAQIPPDSAGPMLPSMRRSNWVRLHTIVKLRWIAVAGQLAAIVAADRMLGIMLELGPLFLVVGAGIVSNLVATFLFAENRRLTEAEMVGLLIFDMGQLCALLALSGGLSNPFALLILSQVTISATTLALRSTLIVCGVAIAMITAVNFWHLPLVTADGRVLLLPDLFVFGIWLAIMIAVVFQAVYARRVTLEVTAMADALAATQMALAREQKLTDLGGVVAAAAHELGTPLATIALVSQEMLHEVRDDPDLAADAALIREQAERCRLILRSMGQAGKDDPHLRHAPIGTVIEQAAGPHEDRGKRILYDLLAEQGADSRQPIVARRPEILHGVRNLVQNAVDFADETVWIGVRWTDGWVKLRIADDGPGFSADVLPRLGDPFVRRRREAGETRHRPNYEGMGLGLFIAKTLLERSGAELTFANGGAEGPGGAVVEVVWPLAALQTGPGAHRGPLGENVPIAV